MKQKYYVIGVDGGGTKTVAALADLKGKILKMAKSGPSSPRNIGIKKAAENVAKAIFGVLRIAKKKKISSVFIGLPSTKEEFKLFFRKKEIEKELLRQKGISKIFKEKVKIGSDQEVAFRSGTNEREGVVLIAGTGCVCRGWRRGKEKKTSGWGYFADEGSGFWVGKMAFQAILKELDGRGKKTLITKLVFKNWKLKTEEGFLKKIYSKDSIHQVSLISKFVDKVAEKRDKIAISIMREAGKELTASVMTVIKKLNFQNQKFPLVLVGRMFKSKIISNIVKKEIKKIAPKVKFLEPKQEPVIGAVKLAIENLQK